MLAFIGLCFLLLVGQLLRTKLRLLQWLYLPACVIGGVVGLAAVQGLNAWHGAVTAPGPGATQPAASRPATASQPEPTPPAEQTYWTQAVISAHAEISRWGSIWAKLPGFLINIVFACLFLGVTLPRFSSLLRRSGVQLAYGQVVAWGQYVVGVGLVLFLLVGTFEILAPDTPAARMFGGVLPVGFEGGHGTAGGLAETFARKGWPDGKHFALASATGGIMSAIIVGMVLINVAARRGWIARRARPSAVPEDDSIGIIPVDRRPSAGKLTVKADAIESFTLHVAFVGVALLIGYGLQRAVAQIDRLYEMPQELEGRAGLFGSIPMFPLCMIGGLLVQIWEQKFDRHKLIDLGLIRRIQNCTLDFLVVAAIATIKLEVIVAGLAPLLILIGAGIVWNVFCVLVLARRLLPDAWFERSIAEMGQSMGVTATGLLLLRVVDPDYESPAADAFATKQLLHEPIMGGGLWTSLAIPLLADPRWGPGKVFVISSAAVLGWLVVLVIAKLLRARRPAAA